MISKNLEVKTALTQEQKKMRVEMDISLMEVCGFNYDKAKRLNPFRKKDYGSTQYGENISPYETR